jgi:hypothetical protein
MEIEVPAAPAAHAENRGDNARIMPSNRLDSPISSNQTGGTIVHPPPSQEQQQVAKRKKNEGKSVAELLDVKMKLVGIKFCNIF